MQKFTRALTREVEVGGERLALTLDAAGLSVRPVGSRRPPLQLSWPAVLCALTARPAGEAADEEVARALEALRGGGAALRALAGETGGGIEGVLARLDAWLRANRRRYHAGLRGGATEGQLAELAAALGREVPAPLAAWLRWHDGQDEELIGAFVESFNLMSAEEIAQTVRERRGEGWPAAFVPILDDYQDDFVVLDLSRPELPVREVWRGRADHPEVATSMAGWLEALLADFEAGRYHEDPERGEFLRGT